MKHMSKFVILIAAIFIIHALASSKAWAVGGSGGGGGGGGGGANGNMGIGLNIGFINAGESDMNAEISALQAQSNTGANQFGNAWEGNVFLSYRLSGSATVLMLRPSYLYYADMSGSGVKYKLSGFAVFPMMKIILLENQTIKFYTQFGVGYGHVSGRIEESGMTVDFSGGNVGYMFGLGAEFCFVPSHCLNVEGSMRYLPIDRMTVSSSSGAIPTGSKLTQVGTGSELEINQRDFGSSMSGVLGMLGYTMYF